MIIISRVTVLVFLIYSRLFSGRLLSIVTYCLLDDSSLRQAGSVYLTNYRVHGPRPSARKELGVNGNEVHPLEKILGFHPEILLDHACVVKPPLSKLHVGATLNKVAIVLYSFLIYTPPVAVIFPKNFFFQSPTLWWGSTYSQ